MLPQKTASTDIRQLAAKFVCKYDYLLSVKGLVSNVSSSHNDLISHIDHILIPLFF